MNLQNFCLLVLVMPPYLYIRTTVKISLSNLSCQILIFLFLFFYLCIYFIFIFLWEITPTFHGGIRRMILSNNKYFV